MVLYGLREVFKNQFLLNYLQKHTKKRKGMAFTIYAFFICIHKYEIKNQNSNKLSKSSFSSPPYSSSSKYSSSFSINING